MNNVMNLLIPAAYAQSAGGAAGGGNMLMTVAPFILIFFVFYFILIRPQQTKEKQRRESMKLLRRGDKVLTAGGIVATVVKNIEDSDEMEVELSPDVKVKVLRSTITKVIESKAMQAEAANKDNKKVKTTVKPSKADKPNKAADKIDDKRKEIELDKTEYTEKEDHKEDNK